VEARAVARERGVEEGEAADPLGRERGDALGDRAAIAMADEQDTLEILVFEEVEDVGRVQLEVDIGAEQVVALAEAGQGGGEDDVAARAQVGQHTGPDPAAEPGTVDED